VHCIVFFSVWWAAVSLWIIRMVCPAGHVCDKVLSTFATSRGAPITGRANNEQRVLYKFGCQHRTASVNDRLWRLASAVSSGTPLTRPLALLQNLNAAEYRNDYWAEDKDIIEDLRTPFNLTASLSRVRDAKHDVQDQKNNEYGYSNEL